jgi:hypothetical protein
VHWGSGRAGRTPISGDNRGLEEPAGFFSDGDGQRLKRAQRYIERRVRAAAAANLK